MKADQHYTGTIRITAEEEKRIDARFASFRKTSSFRDWVRSFARASERAIKKGNQ